MNPPERITPLPWKLEDFSIRIKYDDIPQKKIVGANGKTAVSFPPIAEQWENAAYIVHACNNYPKLEARVEELVEALYGALNIATAYDLQSGDKEMLVKFGKLIDFDRRVEKAKGGSNG